MNELFRDRIEAGELLAAKLISYQNKPDAVILAIPRGGVVVGRAISSSLHLPLYPLVVKKIGAPGNDELAIGAVCADGTAIYDQGLITRLGVTETYVQEETERKQQQARDRFSLLLNDKRMPDLSNRIVILTDDGIATGATVEAAILSLVKQQPRKIILAIPVAPRDTIKRLTTLTSQVIVLKTPESFYAVGEFYESFTQVDDDEVKRLLQTL